MGSKVNYTIVGAFVVLLSIALITLGLWLSRGFSAEKHYTTYLAYMKESVAGLSVNSPVKYNGVSVGFVKAIQLRVNHPEEVKLIVEIEQGTPITESTRAILMSQSITGIAYLGLKGGPAGAPPLLPKPGVEYPVIQTEPSLMLRLDATVKKLSDNIDVITNNVTSVLDQENRTAFKNSLKNLDKTLQYAVTISRNTAQASHQFPTLVNKLQSTLANVDDMSHSLTTAGHSVQAMMAETRLLTENINAQLFPEMINVLQDTQAVVANVKQISSEMKRNPSVLLRGKVPSNPGPGE